MAPFSSSRPPRIAEAAAAGVADAGAAEAIALEGQRRARSACARFEGRWPGPSRATGRRRLRRLWWLAAWALLPWRGRAVLLNTRVKTQSVLTILAQDESGTGCGLDPNATIVIDLLNEQPANNTYIMVLTHAQWMLWRRPPRTEREMDMPNSKHLDSYLVSYWRAVLYDHVQATVRIRAPAKDRYWVLLLNAGQEQLKLSGTISLLNPGGEQVTLQWQKVPAVLLWTSVLFFVSFVLFTGLLARASPRGRTAVHMVVGSVLLMKGLVLLLWWANRMQVSRAGFDSSFGRVGWQLLEKVQSIMELMMFLLIALGWKLLRGSLNITEMRFAGGISVISFYLGVFEVACTTQSTCSSYKLSRYILHALCYLVVIVAMNFNLQMIHAQISDSTASAESGKLYRKYHAYKVFRWVFLAFIIAPTVELFLKVTVVPWDAEWLYWLVVELRTWVLYACMVVAFRPDPPAPRVFELTQTGSDDEGDIAEGVPIAAGPGMAE